MVDINDLLAEIQRQTYGKGLRKPIYNALKRLLDDDGMPRPIESMLQVEYDALESPNPTTDYAITKRPYYDPTKIVITLLDENDDFTTETWTVDTLLDAQQFFTSHNADRYSLIIGSDSGIHAIDTALFLGKQSLVRLYIDTELDSIGSGAFQNTGLIYAELSKRVSSIENSAFSYCGFLSKIVLPSTGTEYGYYTFEYSGLNELTISAASYRLCFSCPSLKKVTILDGPTEIHDGAFSGCSALESVTIPSSVWRIRDVAFSQCINLTSIEIPSSVTTIFNTAFVGSGLTNIIIHKPENSIPGAPWGATNATINWTG